MPKIGTYIKERRLSENISLYDLEKETKIKPQFIESIEEENWQKLPEFPVVLGFIKSIAKVLKLDPEKAGAFFRRDYPPQTLPINPKPDVSKEFIWNPKLTLITGVCLILLLIGGYLGFSYFKFVSPPRLDVYFPKENQTVNSKVIEVNGKSDSDAKVTVNNQPVLLNEDGNFKTELEISAETKELVVIAKSRSGKETIIRRKINPEL